MNFRLNLWYFRSSWPTDLESVLRDAHLAMKVSTQFEVDTIIRYSVIAAVTLRNLVTLTFDLLTLVSGHTWRVTWSTPPPSLKILRLSLLELWVLSSPKGYHWQCVCSQCAMRNCACAVSRDLCVGGQIFPTYLKSLTPICLFTMQLYGATIKTNGVIRQNNVWPCAKDHTLCASAKSHQHWTLP